MRNLALHTGSSIVVPGSGSLLDYDVSSTGGQSSNAKRPTAVSITVSTSGSSPLTTSRSYYYYCSNLVGRTHIQATSEFEDGLSRAVQCQRSIVLGLLRAEDTTPSAKGT
jgi:hypothetical protein